jgi:tyrosyl-tRNA synthetase
MAGAQTGTGKTAAFALPILQRLAPQASTSASPARHPVRALVLTPTRELAVQVAESFHDYGKHLPLRSTVVYGGVDMNAQIAQLRNEVAQGRNPKEAKVLLAKEITARFHDAVAAERAEADFELRARGGVPQDIPELALGGAPLAIGSLLKQARLAPSSSEALRLVEQGGVRIDGAAVSDKGLKLPAGTYVVQVGKRRFARITLAP